MTPLTDLPMNLPIPIDDGKCDHLQDLHLPNISLPATSDKCINLSLLNGILVLYFYPMTGRPDTNLPKGWDDIPGARGCTPQSCSFRDKHQVLTDLKVNIYGISTQSTAYQKEMAERLHLPYEILSDEKLKFSKALELPTITVEGMTMIKRVTLICKEGKILKVFYPVFPPDRNVDDVIDWISKHRLMIDEI